jgi:hypothetical protein
VRAVGGLRGVVGSKRERGGLSHLLAHPPSTPCSIRIPKINSLEWEIAVRLNGALQWLDHTFGKKE